jgi:hypothetical protein
MDTHRKEALLREIRSAEGGETKASSLAGLIRRFLECQDSQNAANTVARALSHQNTGDPVFPQSGIWPIPPA